MRWPSFSAITHEMTKASLIVLCGVGIWVGVDIHKAVTPVPALEAKVSTLVGTANHEVQVNGDEAHRVILEAGLTARQARMASESQRKFWDKEMPRIASRVEGTLDQSQNLIASLHRTSDGLNDDARSITASVTGTTDSLKPTFAAAGTALTAAANTANAATKTLNDPHIAKLIEHLDQTSGQLAGSAADIHRTTTDIAGEVHDFTHPTLAGKIKSYALFGFELVKDLVQIHSELTPQLFRLETVK